MRDIKLVVALGFFDGVHIAHGALLKAASEEARKTGNAPAVIIFDRRPQDVVSGKTTPLLNTAAERTELIRRMYGIDNTISMAFDETLMNTPWDKFILSLTEKYNVSCFVVGYDFRFGHGGEGNAEKLSNLCGDIGAGCITVDKVELDGVTVSSTHIRYLIAEGNVREANRFLGHMHTVTGAVREGKQIGRTIGIPTANMIIPEGVIVPKKGVYAARFILDDGRSYRAVTNIGTRPTVNGGEDVTVESHILDFSGDLYGKNCRVEFADFLRSERKFPSLDALKAQIAADIDKVRSMNDIFSA